LGFSCSQQQSEQGCGITLYGFSPNPLSCS